MTRISAVLTVVSLLLAEPPEIVSTTPECSPVQYIEVGHRGLILCAFDESLLAISWYDVKKGRPLLLYKDGLKSGEGFDSGEFDVYLNGSLVIKNVTVDHESVYRVTKAITSTEPIVPYIINVYTTVKPSSIIPVIEECIQTYDNVCYTSSKSNLGVGCLVRDSRPAVNLTWKQRTVKGDHGLSTNLITTTDNNVTYMSRAETEFSFGKSSLLALLVCQVSSIPLQVINVESIILVENSVGYNIFPNPVISNVKVESPLNLFCADPKLNLIVWKRSVDSLEVFDNLIVSLFHEINSTTEEYKEYELNDNGSLYVQRTAVKHEGRYICVFDEGSIGGAIVYDVLIIVDPIPAFPLVEGCNHQQYCVLEKQPKDMLTCSVLGIRPNIELEWKPFRDDSSMIFTEQQLQVTQRGDVYDVTLTSSFDLKSEQEQMTVECHAVGANAKLFSLSTKIDLLFVQTFEPEQPTNKGTVPIIIITATVIVTLVIITVLFTIFKRRKARLRRQKRKFKGEAKDEEETPMILQSIDYSEKTILFIKQLKTKYQVLCDAVQPVPYMKGSTYNVDRMFVESEMEFMTNDLSDEPEAPCKKVFSYQELLNENALQTKRQIIIGEPGYGKSIMILQIVNDWCKSISTSPVLEFSAVIYLRLRQLGGITSIYSAIRRFILPRDSNINEEDIKQILNKMSNVLVLLDGFDEYPDRECESTDIYHILTKNMFQEFVVVLTTRPSYLPKGIESIAKGIRLTGFGEEARMNYVKKIVKNNDENAAGQIMRKLKTNPVADDFCQVPLFFVMFVHMTHENKHLITFNSVTSFFRHMISCFHSHMKNKMEDDNVKNFELRENNHKELDELAFEAVSGKGKKIVWDTKELCFKVGSDFYEQYTRIGILIEEEILEIGNKFNAESLINYKKEVRFYHKLFCEWYAAYYVAERISEGNTNLHLFQWLDPLDLQYLYRFACGLNAVAASNIIQFLRHDTGTKKLAILCMLEQEDKTGTYIKDVSDLLSSGVTSISNNESKLLQRSTVQILEFAATHQIKIWSLLLSDCFLAVDETSSILVLRSGLQLPALSTLNELHITQTGKEFTSEELTDIFVYISKSTEIKTIKFTNCVLPFVYQENGHMEKLSEGGINVLWFPLMKWYRLNLESGCWQAKVGSFNLGEEHFKRMVEAFREMYKKV